MEGATVKVVSLEVKREAAKERMMEVLKEVAKADLKQETVVMEEVVMMEAYSGWEGDFAVLDRLRQP